MTFRKRICIEFYSRGLYGSGWGGAIRTTEFRAYANQHVVYANFAQILKALNGIRA